MFNVPNILTPAIISDNSHKILGENLKKHGNRVLFICSERDYDKNSIGIIKKQFLDYDLTFIQYDQLGKTLDNRSIKILISRASDFKVTTVVSLGDFTQRMAGRFVAKNLGLPYYELPTTPVNPYLFSRYTAIPTKLNNDYNLTSLSEQEVIQIICDSKLYSEADNKDIQLMSLTLLLELAEMFTSIEINRITRAESLNLFGRILEALENDTINEELLQTFGLTTSLYHSTSNNTPLELTMSSILLNNRFNVDKGLISGNILPWLLGAFGEIDLETRVRKVLTSQKLLFRLKDLGITIKQLKKRMSSNRDPFSILEKAY